MKLMDKLKEFFGRNSKAPDSGISEEEQRQREAELVEKMQNRRLPVIQTRTHQ